jgi:hypothetical protein
MDSLGGSGMSAFQNDPYVSRLSPSHQDRILTHFAARCRSCARSNKKPPCRMREVLHKLHGEIHGRMEHSVEAVRREDTEGEPGQLRSAEHLGGHQCKIEAP